MRIVEKVVKFSGRETERQMQRDSHMGGIGQYVKNMTRKIRGTLGKGDEGWCGRD